MQTLKLTNRHTGEILELRRLQENGEPLFELRGTLPAHREGPPMHIHHVEDEEGRVTSGSISATVGGRRVDAGPGEVVLLPRGVPHRWWNEGDQPLVQAMLFRAVVALGTLLGKYRGTDWPGCPARCTGAPPAT